MRTVTFEEARNAYNNMIEWANRNSSVQKSIKTSNDKEWIFKTTNNIVQKPKQMFIKAEYPQKMRSERLENTN